MCRTSARKQPDFVVVSTGLWHMLHVTDPDGYSQALSVLKEMSNSFMNAQVCQNESEAAQVVVLCLLLSISMSNRLCSSRLCLFHWNVFAVP